MLGELGISTAGAYNKHVDAVRLPDGLKYDVAVTVCSNAAGDCPTFSGTKTLVHAPFDDPPHLAAAAASSGADGGDAATDPLPFYRRVRDEIRAWVNHELPKLAPALAGKQRQLLPSGIRGVADGATDNDGDEGAGGGGASSPGTAPLLLVHHHGGTDADGGASRATPGKLLAPADEEGASAQAAPPARISFFERYLSVWVLLCMVAGALIGYYAPSVPAALERAQFANINAVVAVLLWLMITPMLVQIDFASLWAVKDAPGAIALTTGINYLVKPFTM